MRFAIDAVYLDGVGRVLRIDRALAPRTLAPSCAGAVAVVELPCGAARGTEVGDQIAWAAGTPPQEGQTWQGQPPRR